VAGLVAIVVLGGRTTDANSSGPRSTDPAGTKALVDLLEALGADVTITSDVPDVVDDDRSPLIAVPRAGAALSDAQQRDLEGALDAGATVVVSDPFSALTPPVSGSPGDVGPFATEIVVDPDECTIAALDGIGSIEAFELYAYEVGADDETCYGADEHAYVAVSGQGSGTLVALGGTTPFTNQYLGQADNAALIAAILAPRPGREVVLVQDDALGATAADQIDSPFDLVDSSVKGALIQVCLAFAVYALWRGRRLGRPLTEPQPVDIAGSELVAAVGDLLQRTREPQRAARLLRDDTRRRLCRALGLPTDSTIETLADAVAGRTAVSADRVARTLSTQPVTSDDDLVSLAREIESLRQEIIHDRTD
jgi:hypothetical protein